MGMKFRIVEKKEYGKSYFIIQNSFCLFFWTRCLENYKDESGRYRFLIDCFDNIELAEKYISEFKKRKKQNAYKKVIKIIK